jgi:sortase A
MTTVVDSAPAEVRSHRQPKARPAANRRATPTAGSASIGLRVLYAFSALMIWAVVYTLLLGALQETRAQSVMYAQFRQQLASEVAPIGGAIKSGEPVAILEIPRLGVLEVVVEGTSGTDLLRGPGHRADSPLPGEVGVSVVYGRGATFGGPFRRLANLRPGDKVTAIDGAGLFHYVVQDIRRAGSPLPQPVSAETSRLTLATASGQGWRAGWAPSAPLYVDATMVGPAAGEPGGRVGTVPADEKLMASDTGAMASLVRWLQLLIVVVAATAWAYFRWGRWQAWLVGLPTVMAALWIVSETAVKLLPNVL